MKCDARSSAESGIWVVVGGFVLLGLGLSFATAVVDQKGCWLWRWTSGRGAAAPQTAPSR